LGEAGGSSELRIQWKMEDGKWKLLLYKDTKLNHHRLYLFKIPLTIAKIYIIFP
jgi:hypothetical protein